LVIYKNYTDMHGQQNIKFKLWGYTRWGSHGVDLGWEE